MQKVVIIPAGVHALMIVAQLVRVHAAMVVPDAAVVLVTAQRPVVDVIPLAQIAVVKNVLHSVGTHVRYNV